MVGCRVVPEGNDRRCQHELLAGARREDDPLPNSGAQVVGRHTRNYWPRILGPNEKVIQCVRLIGEDGRAAVRALNCRPIRCGKEKREKRRGNRAQSATVAVLLCAELSGTLHCSLYPPAYPSPTGSQTRGIAWNMTPTGSILAWAQ